MKNFNEYYTDIVPIGEGGMSHVFLATDKNLGRRVALKVIKQVEHNYEDIVAEARLLAKLNHSNIVQVYNVRKLSNEFAIEMEYVQGATLNNYVQENNVLLEEKLSLLIDIAEGLHSAHQQNILHLDLKPSNILINESKTAKIVDFGISQLVGTESSSSPSSFGSLTAMSPEQLRQEPLDMRSDLFSFGLLAYQLLTGSHPYTTQAKTCDDKGIAEEVKTRALNFNARNMLGIPIELAELIDHLLQFKKTERPNGCIEIIQQLKQIMSTVSYEQSGVTQPIPDLSGRKQPINRRWKTASLVCCLCGILGLGTWLWYTHLPKVYVAALPVEFSDNTGELRAQKQVVESTLKNAIEQTFITDERYSVIPAREIRHVMQLYRQDPKNNDLRAIAKALQAEILLLPNARCTVYACEVEFDVIDVESFNTVASDHFSVAVDSPSKFLTAMMQSLQQVITSQNKSVSNTIAAEDYNEYFSLMTMVTQQGKSNEDILAALRKIIVRSPDFYPAYNLLKSATIKYFRKTDDQSVLKQSINILDSAPAQYRQSLNYLSGSLELLQASGKVKEAEALLTKLDNYDFDNYEKLTLKGVYYKRSQAFEKSIDYFLQANKLRPTLTLLRNISILYTYLGDYENALVHLDKVAELAPEDSRAMRLRADLSLLTGQLNRALLLYQQVIEAVPNDLESYSNLATIATLQQQYQQSETYARHAVKHAPEHTLYLLGLADTLLLQGKKEAAHSYYREILALTASTQEYTKLLDRAQALAHLGKHIDALKVLQSLYEGHKNKADYLFSSALVSVLANEPKSAVIAIEQSINAGLAPIFYQLSWFDRLCDEAAFITLLNREQQLAQRCHLL